MAITPKCDKCGMELDEFGAILLSPPNDNSEVEKLHICKDCYEEIMASVKDSSPADIKDTEKKKPIFTSKWTRWIVVVGIIYALYFLAINIFFSSF